MSSAPLIHRVEVDSTQRVARELALEGTPHGTCVVADRQTAGRGRLGREWITPGDDRSLACSLVLHVRCPQSHAPRVTMGAAIGMLQVVPAGSVKWPNDVVIPSAPSAQSAPSAPGAPAGRMGRIGPFRKVAGLLVEVARVSPLPLQELEVVVVGIGVNLRAPAGGWPPELALTAGALDDGRSRDDVLAAVRAHVPDAVARTVRDLAPALDVLRARSATIGRRVTVEGVSGLARDLADDGALLVEDDAGALHTVRAGDVWIE